MTRKTFQLLTAAQHVRGYDKKKKTLPYLKRAVIELLEEIEQLEEEECPASIEV